MTQISPKPVESAPPTPSPTPADDRSSTPTVRNNRYRVAFGLALAAVAALAAMAWWLGLFTAEPEAVSLESTVAAVETDATVTEADEPAAGDEVASAETETATATESVAGTWSVIASDATFVGYRADSQVGEAVGRSSGVSGSLEATDDQVTSVVITADMTQLESDSSLRDEHLGDDGIEYNVYPTSTFSLTEPIAIDTIPADGTAVSFTAVGDLTVRDITQPMTIALEATIVGDQLVVAGSADISLADYGATISSTEDATLEFSLVFERG